MAASPDGGGKPPNPMATVIALIGTMLAIPLVLIAFYLLVSFLL
ncbi:MAG: hypothetical protein AAFR55_00720 [Pseudomonadota bacterium]